VCAAIECITPEHGYIIVTVPRRFPYHPDPIDLMFRPDVAELLTFFPGSRCVNGAIIDGGSFWAYVKHSLLVTLPWAIRHSSNVDKRSLLYSMGSFLASLFVSARITCVVLRKEARSDEPTLR
jgi:hypothetical protein